MLSNEVRNLEIEYENLFKSHEELQTKYVNLKKCLEENTNIIKSIIPEKIYTHKARHNTTVKFTDGSSITVTKKPGEKDCLETAIAYCILKQLLPPKELKKLIKNREEH